MRGNNGAHTASIGLACLALLLAVAPARAETGSLWSQPSLFDTPGGLKQGFRDAGIDVWLTNFGQGIISGDGASDNLKDGLEELGSGLEDEHGVEAFYNLALTTWLRLTADLQWIDPATPDRKDALIGSLRTQIKF